MQSMQEHDTFPGKVYAVTCASGCTITDNKGRTLGECEAGKQTLVVATSDKLLTSADALLTATFKFAPAKLMALGLLGGGEATGGGSDLPAGYLAADFLEGTGTQYILTNWTPTISDELCVDFTMVKYTSGGILGCYPSNLRLVTRIRNWSGVTPGQDVLFSFFSGNGAKDTDIYEGDRCFAVMKNGSLELNSTIYNFISDAEKYPVAPPVYLFAQGKGYNGKYKCYSFIVKEENKAKCDYFPSLDNQGVPCMYDKVTKQPLYNSGSGSFIVGFTLKQALKLSSLPATGGKLTVSLPTGYDSDAGVASALETARANGWTLTVQTYEAEAAAASTFALRRIWVRRTADEDGTYVDTDGSRWMVDWCVDMLTPDGSTPDAHGYELFRSVDAAVAYWELQPYVDPEAEENLTEYNANE